MFYVDSFGDECTNQANCQLDRGEVLFSSIFWCPLSSINSWLTLPLEFKLKNTTFDDRLLGLVEQVEVTEDLVLSHLEMTEKMVAAWSQETNDYQKASADGYGG